MIPNSRPKSVCIIGAGAAGLCALRHFTAAATTTTVDDHDHHQYFHPIVCYEQTTKIGGIWNYTNDIDHDTSNTSDTRLSLHTSMYRDLYTNLPIQIMEFPDFPYENIFDDDGTIDSGTTTAQQSYVHHTVVLRYLHAYAQHYNLYQWIKFAHKLCQISWLPHQRCWQLTINDLRTNTISTLNYDIVILCPGRYIKPRYPNPSPIGTFSGKQLHSNSYRTPEQFATQIILIIGSGPSGIDITLELAPFATKVYLINRGKSGFESLPSNVEQITNSEVVKFDDRTVWIQQQKLSSTEATIISTEGDQNSRQMIQINSVDTIIYATGYHFNLDYLSNDTDGKLNTNNHIDDNTEDTEIGIRLSENTYTIDGLYRHFINRLHPSMALLGIIKTVIPFPLYNQQIQYYIRKFCLANCSSPSFAAMIADAANDRMIREKVYDLNDSKDRHIMNRELFQEYIQKLEKEMMCDDDKDDHHEPKPLPTIKIIRPVVFKLYGESHKNRLKNITTFRRFNYRLLDDENYEMID